MGVLPEKLLRLKQNGDTLVEVLLAIAIVTSVLAGAFAVSQKSAQGVRDSQERGEALQLLQGQVELVRALAVQQTDTTSGVYKTSPSYFCIDANASRTNISLPSSMTVLPALNSDPLTEYAGCEFGTGNRYKIAIHYNGGVAGNKTFTFVVRWDRVGGGMSQEQLNYRVYPSS